MAERREVRRERRKPHGYELDSATPDEYRSVFLTTRLELLP